MKKLSFATTIAAPAERVWQILWNDATYRQWTAVFHEGSHAVSDWQEGGKILFLGPNGDGMSSRIARLIPNEFISFEHLGEIKNGVEDHSAAWSGAQENYRLRQTGSGTELSVELDADDNFSEYFQGAFPKALAKVKELAEATNGKSIITVQTTVAAPLEKVWYYWTKPEHIVHWNFASDDWQSPHAVNNLHPGGAFNYRMEAKDGSAGFDFEGTYSVVEAQKRIEYAIADGRQVQVLFSKTDAGTLVLETFEAENMNSAELQRSGWQAILDNFRKYVEGS